MTLVKKFYFPVNSYNLLPGQLIDVLRRQGQQPLQFQQVLKIFSQVCRAVAHMHKQDPPIIHRDLKVCFVYVVVNVNIFNYYSRKFIIS